MEISITKTVLNKFNYYSNPELTQNIFNYLHWNKINSKGIIKRTTNKINLFNQIGGAIRQITLKDGKTYEYHLDEITPVDDEYNRLCFLNVDETSDYCACLLYNTKKSSKTTLRIEGIFNGEDCIECLDKKHKYKVGNILMLIILELVKTHKIFSHITEIELSDTSIIKCYDIGLQLKYLKTITDGIPFYAKYGFILLKSNSTDV